MGRDRDWKAYLFGEFRLEQNGQEIDVPPYRSQRVLIYLLLNLGASIRRERIASDLFPDLSPDRARARLSDHLWLIRSTLPNLEIESSGDDLKIPHSGVWVDCRAFSGGIVDRSIENLCNAVNLYKGDFAPDLYDDWAIMARERFRSEYLNALLYLASQYEQTGHYQRASEMLERLLLVEPLDETAVRQLMRNYSRVGKRGLALSAYERYRLLCVAELGVEPEPKTQVLYESLLDHSSLPRQSTVIPTPSEENGEKLIQGAVTALNTGDRFNLLNLLRAVSILKNPELVLQRDLLYVDEAIQWHDFHRAWQLLDSILVESMQVDLRRAILCMEQHDLEGAGQILLRLLKSATSSNDRFLEASVLVYLSAVKMHRAEFQEALLSVNRAVAIASKLDSPIIQARAYLQKGNILHKQGSNKDARDALLQAQTLAEEYHLNSLLPNIYFALGKSLQNSGHYLGAHKTYSFALELSRDVGCKNIEAQILLGLAAVCDYLGRNVESIQALNVAREIYRRLKDEIGLAKVNYNLAAALPYHDEVHCPEAIQHAENALEVFERSDISEYKAVTHTALAFALWLVGKYEEAITNYERSIALHKSLGEYNYIPELYAYIGLAYLEMGETLYAMDWTERALDEQSMLNLSDIVADIFYARGAALETVGKVDEAVRFYERAYHTLLEFAREIEEDDARQAYFHRDPVTRRLMEKVYALGLSPQSRQMVFNRVVAGQPGQRIEIALMVDAGAPDQAVAQARGDTKARQIRLQRLLTQAKEQHVHLTLDEMAQALKVSKRTVQRDLITIRNQ